MREKKNTFFCAVFMMNIICRGKSVHLVELPRREGSKRRERRLATEILRSATGF